MIAYQTTPSPAAPQPAPEQSTVSRMADAMLELGFSGQTVDNQALALRGFTAVERMEHAAAALELANARAIKRVP
jgi:hypothetical protein